MRPRKRQTIATNAVTFCNIDRGKFCVRMQATLDHDKHVATAEHYPTQASPLVYYDRGKKFAVMEFLFCPYCGKSLTPTLVKRWRAAAARRAKRA